MIFHDLPYLLHAPSFEGVKELTDQLGAALAGGSADPFRQLGVKVIMAGVALVVVDPQEPDGDDMRAALIGVARQALVPAEKEGQRLREHLSAEPERELIRV
ncbi:MAG TPA: hypothetical protein VFC19_51570 [Candidatus Limnocylindrales bacterium]|nr:hypothetical protein [Candidatus Limnocylindrales bacterium]